MVREASDSWITVGNARFVKRTDTIEKSTVPMPLKTALFSSEEAKVRKTSKDCTKSTWKFERFPRALFLFRTQPSGV